MELPWDDMREWDVEFERTTGKRIVPTGNHLAVVRNVELSGNTHADHEALVSAARDYYTHGGGSV